MDHCQPEMTKSELTFNNEIDIRNFAKDFILLFILSTYNLCKYPLTSSTKYDQPFCESSTTYSTFDNFDVEQQLFLFNNCDCEKFPRISATAIRELKTAKLSLKSTSTMLFEWNGIGNELHRNNYLYFSIIILLIILLFVFAFYFFPLS